MTLPGHGLAEPLTEGELALLFTRPPQGTERLLATIQAEKEKVQEAQEIVADCNNELFGSHGYFTHASGVTAQEAIANLKGDHHDCNSERARWKARAEAAEKALQDACARERALAGERDAANRGRAEWREKCTAAEAKVAALVTAGKDCADELRCLVEAYYQNTKDYPSEKRRYDRDIEPADNLDRVIANVTGPQT